MTATDSQSPDAKARKAYQRAEARIAQAARNGSTSLSLSGLGLTSVPPEIGQLNNVMRLDLDNNQLTSVPPEIGQLANLTELYLSSNQLTGVPPEIGQVANLTQLYLSDNQLTSVPPEIGQLANLTELHLQLNQLTRVPPEIGQLASLTMLSLAKNELARVPPEIGQLANLTELYLNDNKLTNVPPEIGQLANLTTLYLINNRLTSLPESLRRCSRLKTLFLHDNPKLDLPASVLGVSFDDWVGRHAAAPKPGPILDYYFRTRDASERRPLCEGKLILVGRGDVGKTSLVRRLIDNTFSRREDTTQGIRICKLPVVAGRKKDTIQMHVWDFGGQEIMHATHQLFLTDRSLYLVVLDGRAGQQEAEADYWLRLIASLAPESPVLVVLNKIKKDHFALNRNALQQKFPQVVDFVETDCDNPGRDKKPGKNGQGIEELRKKIAQQVDKLPEIRQPFPNSWFAIKDELCKPRRKNFLTVDQYRSLCEEHGEASPESQDNLSLFLHRLGIALNFSDDPRLHDKHVLNPHWLRPTSSCC